MRSRIGTAAAVACFAALAAAGMAEALRPAPPAAAAQDQALRVRDGGRLVVPEDYRTEFVALGTWAVASNSPTGDAAEFHRVYAAKEVVEAYRTTGRFPDGAVLVKEVTTARAEDMTTGRVSRADEVLGWFVMVKDTEGRYPGDPLWGDGWGWAWFDAEAPDQATTTDYKEECLGCHVPAQGTDWVYIEGYPLLRDRPVGGTTRRRPADARQGCRLALVELASATGKNGATGDDEQKCLGHDNSGAARVAGCLLARRMRPT